MTEHSCLHRIRATAAGRARRCLARTKFVWGTGLSLVCLLFASSAGAQVAAVATDVGTLGGPYGQAIAVNANGQAVGLAYTVDNAQHAFSWTQTGGMIDLGALIAGSPQSQATAVNASGQVVGWFYTAG